MLIKVGGQNCDSNFFPGGEAYYDTYHPVASDLNNWKHYNTHDPTVNKHGDWFYMYSTDASWGNLHKTGSLKRRSKDLVNWEFTGTAFDGIPQSAEDFFKTHNPSYTDQGIWAPFLLQYKNKYILYYSGPGGLNGVNLAYLGYATSDSANGPWEDQGVITTSSPGDTINAIDPSVVYDSVENKLWMAYGSWHTGLYVLELDTATGGIKTPGDRGVKIAARQPGYGLEGPEISYRNGWYYLFVSYDPLGDIYNVRVGRSKNPNGPYYDINGIDMAQPSSNTPMILSPYQFKNHPGWQGTAHCAVYNDNGNYYMFNQGRPSIEPAMMVLHTRKIFWIDDWPVVSPEPYAGVTQCALSSDSLIGTWEHMPLIYKRFGSYHSISKNLKLNEDGSLNDNSADTWTFDGDTLKLNWDGADTQKLLVFWGWDWENNCKTILFTGMDESGLCIWGKKIIQSDVDRYTKLIHGASYQIKSLNSHLLMDAAGGSDIPSASVIQNSNSGGESQIWKIKDAGFGSYFLFPKHSETDAVLEVVNGSITNGSNIVINPINGTDKQKFFIYSNGNGYFRILSKVSNALSGLDVWAFSVDGGANIMQWEYLGGVNQIWRFERIDSIALDTTPADTFDFVGIRNNELSSLAVFPNPSEDGNFTIKLSDIQKDGKASIYITNLNGTTVFHRDIHESGILDYDMNLPSGIYIVRLISGRYQYVKKLIVL